VPEPAPDDRPLVCVDLDGVLNTFDAWVAPEYFHPPRPGAREFLKRLHDNGFRVCIFTCRWWEWTARWLEENGMAEYVESVTDKKPPAIAYVDDRAICFTGDFSATYQQILCFRPFWESAERERAADGGAA